MFLDPSITHLYFFVFLQVVVLNLNKPEDDAGTSSDSDPSVLPQTPQVDPDFFNQSYSKSLILLLALGMAGHSFASHIFEI